jgi:hypothetical protein
MNKDRISLSKYVTIIFQTPETFSHWFGYYNYSPMNSSGDKMLAHRVSFDGKPIEKDDIAEVGWFDMKSGKWNLISQTNAFNWQQGAMLQWLNQGRNNEVIYNCANDTQFVSKVVNIEENTSRVILTPVYGVTKDAKSSVSIEFERSYWCRAYHYETIANKNWDVRVAKNDGIFHIDIETGNSYKIVSILDIINIDYEPYFENSKHWLEHIMINKSGTRFAFYHRFEEGNGFRTRIFTANIDGTNLFLVKEWRENKWSHLGWKNDDEFVVFGVKRLLVGNVYQSVMKNSNIFGKIVKQVYTSIFAPFVTKRMHHKLASNTCYQLYKDKVGRIGVYSKGELINDGHPSFTSDGRFMLTDTYEDAECYRHLLLYDINNDKVIKLGEFYSPFNSCNYRSDLHPRFSPDESHVIIDSAHSGKHQIAVLKVKWELLLPRKVSK